MVKAVMQKGETMDNLISTLSEIRSEYNCLDEAEEPYYRALSEAIEALSAQPETHGKRTETHACDLISRQQAISRAVELRMFDRPVKMVAVSELERLPSAEPERKKGRWVYNSPATMKCNQCGLVIKDWDWNRFKYCPNCISDMRGE